MGESNSEKLSRLRLMAHGDDQWDLSDNDCAAITFAVERIAALEAELVAERLKSESEKVFRVGYQDTVYAVCNYADRLRPINRPTQANAEGRALDAAVAEKVMGWKLGRVHHGGNMWAEGWIDTDGCARLNLPRFSTDANAAALVLAEIERRGKVDGFVRGLRRELYRVYGDDDTMPQLWRFVAASPVDICRAALLAVCEEGK